MSLFTGYSSIVVQVDASIIGGAFNANPIGVVDTSFVGAPRSIRESAGHLDPPVLLPRNEAYFVGNFREILVLAKHNRYVVSVSMGEPNDVDGEANIDAFLFSDTCCVGGAAGNLERFVTVPKWPTIDVNALARDGQKLPRPEVIPLRIVTSVGKAGIKSDLTDTPPPKLADGMCQLHHVVVGMGAAEGVFDAAVEVLTVDENEGPFIGRFDSVSLG